MEIILIGGGLLLLYRFEKFLQRPLVVEVSSTTRGEVDHSNRRLFRGHYRLDEGYVSNKEKVPQDRHFRPKIEIGGGIQLLH